MIYLDNSATTKPYPEVVEVYSRALQEYYGNPSSLHNLGVEAEHVINRAREVIARILDVSSEGIVFTSGGTEGNNLAIFGLAEAYATRGKHLITTQVEHSSVYEPFKHLENNGYEVTYLSVDRFGEISIDELKAAIRDDTILVSVMHVNNEIGTIQPIAEIGELLAQYPKIAFHVDAVQSFGKIPLYPGKWRVDLLTLSGHKFHGPKGVGMLYKSPSVRLTPTILGGGQEQGIRPGTQNVPGIIAFTKAMRMSADHLPSFATSVERNRSLLWDGLVQIPGIVINSPRDGAPHIVNMSALGIKPEVLLHALEEKGIYVSTQSACSSKKNKISRVLKAMNLPMEQVESAIRISLSAETTEDEIHDTIRAFQEIIPRLQKIIKV